MINGEYEKVYLIDARLGLSTFLGCVALTLNNTIQITTITTHTDAVA